MEGTPEVLIDSASLAGAHHLSQGDVAVLTEQHASSRVEALQQGLACCSLLWLHQVCLVQQNDICKLHLQAPPTRLQMLHESRCRSNLRRC